MSIVIRSSFLFQLMVEGGRYLTILPSYHSDPRFDNITLLMSSRDRVPVEQSFDYDRARFIWIHVLVVLARCHWIGSFSGGAGLFHLNCLSVSVLSILWYDCDAWGKMRGCNGEQGGALCSWSRECSARMSQRSN